MTVQELINLITENRFYSLLEVEDAIDCKKVASGLELDKHRWYSKATDVYKCDDGFVGVKGVYQSFSDMQDWRDIDVLCEAEEYKEVQTVTYEPFYKKGEK